MTGHLHMRTVDENTPAGENVGVPGDGGPTQDTTHADLPDSTGATHSNLFNFNTSDRGRYGRRAPWTTITRTRGAATTLRMNRSRVNATSCIVTG